MTDTANEKSVSMRLKETSERSGEQTLLLYAAVLDVLEAFAKGSAVDVCMQLLTRRIESLTNGMHCSIMLLGSSGCHFEKVYAPSLAKEYAKALRGLEIGPEVGSCGTAAYNAKRVVVADTYSDELWKNYVEVAKKYRLRACWSEPIFSDEGSVLGTFAMYYRDVRSPSTYELEIIAEAAHIASVLCSRKHLEEKLAFNQRTAMHYEERISQYQKLNTFARFTGEITHRLNNTLAGLSGQLQLMELCNMDGREAREALSNARRSCKEVVELVDKLSGFSRTGRKERVRKTSNKIVKTKPLLVIVDDEFRLVHLGRQIAEHYGIEVRGFTDPVQALVWFGAHAEQVDAVLFDVSMPGMDGIECYQQFKKVKKGIHYYVYSGAAPDERCSKLICANEISFLQKPLDYKSFFTELTRVLNVSSKSKEDDL